MQALRHPGSAPPADATWQELVPLTRKLFYEKSGLLRGFFFFFFLLFFKKKTTKKPKTLAICSEGTKANGVD